MYILAYGSLRVGQSWYNDIKKNIKYQDSIMYIDTIELSNINLYKVKDPETNDYHDFIAAIPTIENNKIIADIIWVSEDLYTYINSVIEHSNFKRYRKIIKDYSCDIYLYKDKLNEEDKVEIKDLEYDTIKGRELRRLSITSK